ncbi:LOW QUALITY PROTEIN: Kinesin domain-containing protein [Cephalotus follicularis]|uniref:Kinesin domain-containing protein n=1 Tax=Cephalotus follicularis TaxID=3775 RepID=A0A1Q3DEH0_CEPFO|nr:LOW QUALITY PROTEIN: Kinesin domain-containing protein [Cephalotus follicularis]
MFDSRGKASHIPYRYSKLTQILQDALGGKSHTALLCCCSPSPSNAPESLSTLRFGTSISSHHCLSTNMEKGKKLLMQLKNSCGRILSKLRERLDVEDVKLLEDSFILEGILFDPNLVEDFESAFQDVTSRTISSLQKAVEDLAFIVEEVRQNTNEKLGLIAGIMTYKLSLKLVAA